MQQMECRYISEYQKIYNISIEMINDVLNARRGDRGPPMDAAPVNIVLEAQYSSRKKGSNTRSLGPSSLSNRSQHNTVER